MWSFVWLFLELEPLLEPFMPPDKKVKPEELAALKLQFCLENFEKSTQTPHLMAKIPGSMIHPEQDVMLFDYSNRLARIFVVSRNLFI